MSGSERVGTSGERSVPGERPVLVRVAGPDDVAAIVELRRLWTEERLDRPTDDGGFEGRLENWLHNAGRLVFVAECSAERGAECSAERGAECSAERWAGVLGMVNLAFFDRMPSPERADSRWAYLANAYVRPEQRDRGVGAALVEAAVRAARERGCARIVLAPSERSVPFYRRAGFGPATTLMVQGL